MRVAPRILALAILVGLPIIATGCNSNKNKIVGKWKMVSMTKKDGKEEKAPEGFTFLLEFTADGNVKLGMDLGNLPAEIKEKAGNKADEMHQLGTYKVSGSTLELQGTGKGDEGPFGKRNRGTVKFEGNDTMLITDDEGTAKLTRVK
jgi:hypothetical protein